MQKIHYLCNYKSYLLWYRPSHVLAEHMTSHSHSQSTKVWQSWLGSHTFCCDGRLLAHHLKPAMAPMRAPCSPPRRGARAG